MHARPYPGRLLAWFTAPLVLGHVYWRYGIVAAAIAYICADATLWGLGPWLLAW